MFFQIEITTYCNFRCFYCAGRHMPSQHMEMALFNVLLASIPRGHHTVSLQGEGEPLAHPQFWQMLDMVLHAGHRPYLITNASFPETVRLLQHVPLIGVSIDTLDAKEALKIGRLRLDRVLTNFENMLNMAGSERIAVHTVDYGQSMTELRDYLHAKKVTRHVVQPLQTKEDYRRHYPDACEFLSEPESPKACSYLISPHMRFFDVNGIGMPCPYIKDVSLYKSEARLLADYLSGRIPVACRGCREVQRLES